MRIGSVARGAVVCAALAASHAHAEAPTPWKRPFETVLPWTLERGVCDAAGGLLRRVEAPAPFFADRRETRRDEWRLSLVDLACGLGSGGEARVQFGLQRFVEEGGLEKTGIQDARISFTYRLPARWIDTALHLAVKLPNASEKERLGTDAADIFLVASAGRRGARRGWGADLGLAILGSPTDAGVQDDVIVGGVAGWVGLPARAEAPPLTLMGEIHGTAASRFGNDARYARAGVRLWRRFPVDLSLRRGLTSESERWGVEAGVTFRAERRTPARGRAESSQPAMPPTGRESRCAERGSSYH